MIKLIVMNAVSTNVEPQKRMTVTDAIQKGGQDMPSNNVTITVNGKEATLESRVSDNDRIVVTPNIDNG